MPREFERTKITHLSRQATEDVPLLVSDGSSRSGRKLRYQFRLGMRTVELAVQTP